MKQISLKFKSYAGNVSIVDNSNLGRRVFHFVLLSLGALAVFYVVLLGFMVSNIIERRSLEAEARALSGEAGNLEITYLSLSGGIDLDFSRSLGFKEISPIFAVRKYLGLGPTNESMPGGEANQNDI